MSRELIELLNYMETTTDEAASKSQSKRIKELHRRVSKIKSSEEIGVRYMQEWEERTYERQEARGEGERIKLIKIVRKIMKKGTSPEGCAELLDEDISMIREIYGAVKGHPDWGDMEIYEGMEVKDNETL